MCAHEPHCPDASSERRTRACVVADHWEQGWCLLCNGVVIFDDSMVMLPDGTSVPPLATV